MARKSGFVRRNNVMRRETMWVGIETGVTTLASASAAAIMSVMSAAFLALRPFTIVRTRGFFHMGSDQAAAAEGWGGTIGWCVVSDQAVAVGITAVPTPEADSDSDLWYVHESMLGKFEFITGTGALENGAGRQFDSKAMRKVDDGSQIVQVGEVPAAGASSVVIPDTGRILIKLH